MAITKTLIANGSKGHHKFTLNVTETGTSGNSSFNDYSFILAPIQKGWDWADWKDKISYEIKFTEKVVNEETNQITINELYKATGTIPAYNGSSTVILSSGSDIEIEHESDGTKTIDISFKVTDNTGATYTCGNASASGAMELTDLHTSPDLSLSSITENNANLSGVSGTTFVTYLSKKKFTVGYTLYDNATAKSIKIYDKVGNELSATITLGTSSATIEVDFSKQNIPANAIANNTTSFSIELTDSMNGKTIITTQDYTVVPYFLPNLITTSSSVKRNGQTTGKALLNLLGSFYNSKIGSKSNSISLSFKYWQSGGTEPSTYNTIPSNVNTGTGNNVSISKWKIAISEKEITNVNKSYTYKFKIKAVDTFGNSSEIELTCSKGEWLIARFKDRVDFKKITQGGKAVALEPTELYNGASKQEITLNDSVANYKRIEIFYCGDGDNAYESVSVDTPNGKNALLMSALINLTGNYVGVFERLTIVSINTNKITPIKYGQLSAGSSAADANYITITKVIGYK